MFYLMFCKEGRVRTFPLSKPVLTIGRTDGNDIVLNDPQISKNHCRIELFDDAVEIEDLDSVNGVFVNDRRVHKHRLGINDSFCCGDTCFYVKKGTLPEVRISRELSDIIFAPPEKSPVDGEDIETTESRTRYDALLARVARFAVTAEEFTDFIAKTKAATALLIRRGSLFLYHDAAPHVLVDGLKLKNPPRHSPDLSGPDPASPAQTATANPPLGRLAVESATEPRTLSLLYVYEPARPPSPALRQFLQHLLEVVEFRLRLIPAIPFAVKPESVLHEGENYAIIGTSPSMRQLVQIVRKIAPKPSSVLICGENGTGKELFARMLHDLSGRRRYIAINCAAIPVNLLESELFGYEKGAFTDARTEKAGKIVEASGGTLVFDEIGDMPPNIQAKLLRVIQERTVTPLGGNQPIPVDIRIVALTNHDLYRLTREKKFRDDLFFRIRGHELFIPPLRERREDIVPLIQHYTRVYARKNGVRPGPFSQEAGDCLVNYDWPGNIRELENEIARLMEIIENEEIIELGHLLPSIVEAYRKIPLGGGAEEANTTREKIKSREREDIVRLLLHHGGVKKKAAQALGMSYRGFLKKLERLGIE